MGKAPDKCPMCGERINWKLVDTSNKGFSVGKYQKKTCPACNGSGHSDYDPYE